MNEGQKRYQAWAARQEEWPGWHSDKGLQGPYSRAVIDYIEQFVVTPGMIDTAIGWRQRAQPSGLPVRVARSHIRRNIALGIRAGAYGLWPRGAGKELSPKSTKTSQSNDAHTPN